MQSIYIQISVSLVIQTGSSIPGTWRPPQFGTYLEDICLTPKVPNSSPRVQNKVKPTQGIEFVKILVSNPSNPFRQSYKCPEEQL